MDRQQLEAETGQTGSRDTDQFGDPAGLETQHIDAIARSGHRHRDVGNRKAFDSQSLTPSLKAAHPTEHMFDDKKNGSHHRPPRPIR
jgi:hypothetical protein